MTNEVIETKYGWHQKNEDKTNVDDIVELIKTDEQTNSVELKKEAQLHICEKRLIELEKENEQLKHNNKMLSMKMSEVSTKYRLLKEFSEDTNPNDAVKTVLHELMMITKEYR